MDIPEIERRLADLHGSINLRPTLDRAADIGELLIDAKLQLDHGDWRPWLKKVGVHPRSANDYMAVFRFLDSGKERPAANMGIKEFIAVNRRARRQEKKAMDDEDRNKLADEIGHRSDLKIVHVDCERHTWPMEIDMIATDPPWEDMEAYHWLAEFAAKHLKERGLLMVQAFGKNLPEVYAILGAHLRYLWTYSFIFAGFTGKWSRVRPVLVYAKHEFELPWCSDGFICNHAEKTYHPWQQPTDPWRYWLSKLTTPGQLVADPFAGSATIGVVCNDLRLRFEGTEIEEERFKTARGRLATVEAA